MPSTARRRNRCLSKTRRVLPVEVTASPVVPPGPYGPSALRARAAGSACRSAGCSSTRLLVPYAESLVRAVPPRGCGDELGSARRGGTRLAGGSMPPLSPERRSGLPREGDERPRVLYPKRAGLAQARSPNDPRGLAATGPRRSEDARLRVKNWIGYGSIGRAGHGQGVGLCLALRRPRARGRRGRGSHTRARDRCSVSGRSFSNPTRILQRELERRVLR